MFTPYWSKVFVELQVSVVFLRCWWSKCLDHFQPYYNSDESSNAICDNNFCTLNLLESYSMLTVLLCRWNFWTSMVIIIQIQLLEMQVKLWSIKNIINELLNLILYVLDRRFYCIFSRWYSQSQLLQQRLNLSILSFKRKFHLICVSQRLDPGVFMLLMAYTAFSVAPPGSLR